MADPNLTNDETRLLRRSFEVARQARADGNHPFGALLAGPDGAVMMEQGNGFASAGGDMTAHAERLLASAASRRFGAAVLADCTMYVSAEPCAMCAGAIYWAGIGRVVYGQAETGLKQQTGAHAENPTLNLPCRTIFDAGQRGVVVSGPHLESEAALLQDGFWVARD